MAIIFVNIDNVGGKKLINTAHVIDCETDDDDKSYSIILMFGKRFVRVSHSLDELYKILNSNI